MRLCEIVLVLELVLELVLVLALALQSHKANLASLRSKPDSNS